ATLRIRNRQQSITEQLNCMREEHTDLKPSGLPEFEEAAKLSQRSARINLRRRRGVRAHEDPDNERNAVPTEQHRGAFPTELRRNEHIFRTQTSKSARALHRSG